jgi:MFS family permease
MTLTSTSRLPLVLACGGSFLAFIDVTIANLAVPSLAADYPDAGLSTLSWVVSLYAVAFAAGWRHWDGSPTSSGAVLSSSAGWPSSPPRPWPRPWRPT